MLECVGESEGGERQPVAIDIMMSRMSHCDVSRLRRDRHGEQYRFFELLLWIVFVSPLAMLKVSY